MPRSWVNEPGATTVARMATCDELREQITALKRRRNNATKANAHAEDVGQPPPHSDADVQAMRLAVDMAALEARLAGCDVDDLVGPNVGNLDNP